MNWYLIVLISYATLLVGLGLWLGRRVRHTRDFFVAGRALGPGLLFSTVLAANIGAGSTVGAAGLGYLNGLSGWWWVGSAGVGTILLAYWIGPRIWRLASDRGFYTVGDFLEHKYGPAARGVVAVLLWLGTLALLAGQLVALAMVLDVVVGIPKAVSCFVGGTVMIIYFAAGGLAGSAWINVVQLVVLLLGFAVAVPIALSDVGGIAGLMTRAESVSADYANFWKGGTSGWIYLPLLVPNFMISPGLLQKVYGGKDVRAIRRGVGIAAAVLFVFAFAPVILGMVARLHYPVLDFRELALPTLLMNDLPLMIGAIALGALFMAEISSADAILFMLATSLSKDLYKRFVHRAASDQQVLKVARVAAVVGGLAAILLAIVSESVVDALSIFYTLVGVTIFVPIVAGLYLRLPGKGPAFAAFAFGIGTTLWAEFLAGGALPETIPASLVGIVAAAVGFVAARRLKWNIDGETATEKPRR